MGISALILLFFAINVNGDYQHLLDFKNSIFFLKDKEIILNPSNLLYNRAYNLYPMTPHARL